MNSSSNRMPSDDKEVTKNPNDALTSLIRVPPWPSKVDRNK